MSHGELWLAPRMRSAGASNMQLAVIAKPILGKLS
jgi:hypothetical protein